MRCVPPPETQTSGRPLSFCPGIPSAGHSAAALYSGGHSLRKGRGGVSTAGTYTTGTTHTPCVTHSCSPSRIQPASLGFPAGNKQYTV